MRDRAQTWLVADEPLGKAWVGEYAMFCLGISLRTAGACATAYAFGLARNHPFVDGNKRIALVAAFTFLELHGWNVSAEEPAAVLVFLDLAAGEVEEQQLAVWLRENSAKV